MKTYKVENWIIRDAVPADAEVIAQIYNESIVAGDCTMDDELKCEEEIREWILNFSDQETILLLEIDDEVLGWGIIKQYSPRSGYRFTCETSVYLHRHLVGQGYGSILKQAIIDRCREYGYHHLVAKIMAINTISIEYNKKFGYEIVGVQKEIGYRDGRYYDVVVMQLILPTDNSIL